MEEEEHFISELGGASGGASAEGSSDDEDDAVESEDDEPSEEPLRKNMALDEKGSSDDDSDDGKAAAPDAESPAGVNFPLVVKNGLQELLDELEVAHNEVLRKPKAAAPADVLKTRAALLMRLGVDVKLLKELCKQAAPQACGPADLVGGNGASPQLAELCKDAERPNFSAQVSALLATLRALLLRGEPRGLIVMPCGSGKSFVLVWVAVALQRFTEAAQGNTKAADILVLVPEG